MKRILAIITLASALIAGASAQMYYQPYTPYSPSLGWSTQIGGDIYYNTPQGGLIVGNPIGGTIYWNQYR